MRDLKAKMESQLNDKIQEYELKLKQLKAQLE